MNRSSFISIVVAIALGGATGYCFRQYKMMNDGTGEGNLKSVRSEATEGLGDLNLNSSKRPSLHNRPRVGMSCFGMLKVEASFGSSTPEASIALLVDFFEESEDTLPHQLKSYLCLALAETFASHSDIDALVSSIDSMDLRSQIEYSLRKVRNEQYELQKLGRVCPELALTQLSTGNIDPNEETLVAIGLGLLKTSPESLLAVLNLSEDPAAVYTQFLASIENVKDIVHALELLPESNGETLNIAMEALAIMDPEKALDVAGEYPSSQWIAALYAIQAKNPEIAMDALGLIAQEAPEHLTMLITAIDSSEIARNVISNSDILNLEPDHVGALIKKLTFGSKNDAKEFFEDLPDHLRQDESIARAIVHSLAQNDLDEALTLFDNDIGYAETGIAAALAGNADLDTVKEHLILNPEVVSVSILQTYSEKSLLNGVTLPDLAKQAQLFAPEQKEALLNSAVSFAAKADPYSASLLLANIVNNSGDYDRGVRNLVIEIPDDYEAQLQWIETISDPTLRESVTREISQ